MVIIFDNLFSLLKKRKYPIVGMINNLIKLLSPEMTWILSKAKKEINIKENQNITEIKKNLSFKKL